MSDSISGRYGGIKVYWKQEETPPSDQPAPTFKVEVVLTKMIAISLMPWWWRISYAAMVELLNLCEMFWGVPYEQRRARGPDADDCDWAAKGTKINGPQ